MEFVPCGRRRRAEPCSKLGRERPALVRRDIAEVLEKADIKPADIRIRTLEVGVNPAHLNWQMEQTLLKLYWEAAGKGVNLVVYAIP